jgi:CRP-like cAMP-binding protein
VTSPVTIAPPHVQAPLCAADLLPLLNALPYAKVRTYRKGELIYANGADVFCYLTKGYARAYRALPREERMSVGIFGPGQFFGEGALNGTGKSENAIALTEAIVARWAPIEIVRIVQTFAATPWSKLLAMRAEYFAERLAEQWLPTDARLAATLLRLDRAIGRDGVEELGPARSLPAISHEVLAQELATSREITTDAMGRLARAGRVVYDRKSIGLWPAKLREICHASA